IKAYSTNDDDVLSRRHVPDAKTPARVAAHTEIAGPHLHLRVHNRSLGIVGQHLARYYSTLRDEKRWTCDPQPRRDGGERAPPTDHGQPGRLPQRRRPPE